MKIQVYVVWNKIDDRPTLTRELFGSFVVFPTIAQAQASIYDMQSKENYSIKQMTLSSNE